MQRVHQVPLCIMVRMGSISSTLFHMTEPLTGLTWLNAPETLTSFERAIGVIAELKSDLHHRDWQKRAL